VSAGLDLDKLLESTIEDPSLRNVAIGIFEYANVLLDDDENLTRIGNLNGVAKGKLRQRTMELLGVEASPLDGDQAQEDSEP